LMYRMTPASLRRWSRCRYAANCNGVEEPGDVRTSFVCPHVDPHSTHSPSLLHVRSDALPSTKDVTRSRTGAIDCAQGCGAYDTQIDPSIGRYRHPSPSRRL
jgi:hypothetical protein